MAEITLVLGMLLLFIPLAFGTSMALGIFEIIVRYWWVLGILLLIRCILVGLFSKNGKKFIILDILKTSMIYFVIFGFSHGCLTIFDGNGSVVFKWIEFLIEFIIEGGVLFGLISAGYYLCINAREQDEIIKYIGGCLPILIAVVICAIGYH